jgi:DNA replication and repair protein RecF
VVCNDSLCRAGAALTSERLQALTQLGPYASKRYSGVAGGGRLELTYSSVWLGADEVGPDAAAIEEALRVALQANRDRELERRVSLVGPQRDDVSVGLVSGGDPSGGIRDARVYGSQGDQRTCALALKLGEHDLVTEAAGEQPILLLDDVFSELDPARRKWLGDAVRGMGQTILTSAEPGARDSAAAAEEIEVSRGRLRRV